LQAVHDLLQANAPAMVVSRDSAHFRRWLEVGLRQAEVGLPKVRDGRSYYFLLQGYVAGFRDAHIVIDHNRGSHVFTDPIAWPGFVIGLRGGDYEVEFRAPDIPGAPPLGARLRGCDGKDVGDLIAQHDRYDGDLSLAAARDRYARFLLLDRGDPFVPRAAVCAFDVAGRVREFELHWRELDKTTAGRIAAEPPERKLSLATWGPHRWWLTIPSLDQDQPWTGFFEELKAHLDEVRGADAVVIDLRGNEGGSGDFVMRLADLLWGEALADARRPDSGPSVWRASKRNRDFWADAVEQINKSPEFSNGIKGYARRILAAYDQALANGDPTFTIKDITPRKWRGLPGRNPMRARVVALTDSACTSACLDLMDTLTAMPNVVQAGTPTSADTIFMEMAVVPALPSGLTAFGYGQKALPYRPRASNAAYIPSIAFTWRGAKNDEAGLRAWLERALAGHGR
jgi:hypothetical protein